MSALLEVLARVSNPLKDKIKPVFQYVLKHPFKTIFFLGKAYLLLMLFAFFLAFSSNVFSAEPQCEAGETYSAEFGCGKPITGESCQIKALNGRNFSGTVIYSGNAVEGYSNALAGYNKTNTGGTACPWTYQDVYTHTFDFSCSEVANGTTAIYKPYNVIFTRTGSTRSYNSQTSSCVETDVGQSQTASFQMLVSIEWQQNPQCPISHPNMQQFNDETYCFRPYVPPCDCKDLNGEGAYTYQSFLAAPDAYSQESPPQCLSINDSTDPAIPSCNCQIVATKWFSSLANVNGVEMTRWQPLPTPQGEPSGIYTGRACGEEETETPPAEKENCITMKNGVEMCVQEKANKCIVLDGIEQCESGCGTKNGEFICTTAPDDNNVNDPDAPNKEIDDEITDPDKLSDQMTKTDYKEINKGIETRLDLLAQLVERGNNKAVVGGSANGSKIDSTNRLLGEINDKLGEISEDGETEEPTAGQPDYSTDALEEFVTPNDWETKNFGTVMQAATERMKQAPVFTAVDSFFNVSITGSCPAWSTSVVIYGTTLDINFDQYCAPAMADIWPIIRAVLILVFSYFAFREAVL